MNAHSHAYTLGAGSYVSLIKHYSGTSFFRVVKKNIIQRETTDRQKETVFREEVERLEMREKRRRPGERLRDGTVMEKKMG